MAGNTARIGVQATGVTKASSDLDKLRDKFDKLQKQGDKISKQGVKGIGIGIGAGIGLGAIGLAETAVSGLGNAIGDMTEKAEADEESQNRLRASLRANVPAFDGNTDAIERSITSAQRLGFNDEQLRDSLTILVGATHDVAQAQKIMGTAMDLARFKGIDLKTASQALIAVEGGRYRSLVQLGIKLKDGATQTEALAAVQKVATGQAEAFAETTSGKLLASQIKVDEALEKLGYRTMPAVAAATTALADAVDGLVTSLDEVGHLGDTDKALDGLTQQLNSLGGKQIYVAETTETVKGKLEDDLVGAVGVAARAMALLGEQSEETKNEVTLNMGDMVDAMVKDAKTLADDFFGPIETSHEIVSARSKLHAAEVARSTAKTRADYLAAGRDATSALQDEYDGLVKAASQHVLSQKAVDNFAADARREYTHLNKTGRAKVQGLIDKVNELAAIDGVNVTASVKLNKRGNVVHGGKEVMATGGILPPGGEATVGEGGLPETIRALAHGGVEVIPDRGRRAGVGGGDTHIHATFLGDIIGTPQGIRAAIQGLTYVGNRKASTYDRVSIR